MAHTKPEGILCFKGHCLESHSKLFQQTLEDQLPVYDVVFYVPGDTEICNIVSIRGKRGISECLMEKNYDGLGDPVSASILLGRE